MYRNLLFLFIIPIFFNFFHCFKPEEKLVQRYLEENIYNDKQLQKLNTDLCEEAKTDITIRLKTCRRIFKLLRNDPEYKNPFEQILYMNYEAFYDQSNAFLPVCQKIKVRVDKNTITDHICMPCYSRQAVDSGYNPYLKAICISYGPTNSVIVFKCSDSQLCKLQEWYGKNKLESSFLKPPEDFDFVRAIPIPKTADLLKLMSQLQKDKDYLHNMSSNTNHFIRILSVKYLDVLCDVMFKRAEFMDKFLYQRAKTMKRKKHKYFSEYNVTIIDIFVPITRSHKGLPISKENTVGLEAYPCERYEKKGRKHSSYKIMSGPNETSVILIEPTLCNGEPCLIPLELVENVSMKYLRFIEKYF